MPHPFLLILAVLLLIGSSACGGRKAATSATAEDPSRCCEKDVDAYDAPELEVQPGFPGGEAAMYAYLGNNLQYPEAAHERGAQGTSYVQFHVACDGSLRDAFVKVGVDPDLDSAAVRVVRSMPVWTPGKMKDKPVCSRMVLPVKFELK